MAFFQISALLLFTILCPCITAAPFYQGLNDFLNTFEGNKCSILKNVNVPIFDSTFPANSSNLFDNLKKPLEICERSSQDDRDLLCKEVYEMILSISACDEHTQDTNLLEDGETVSVNVRDDVCAGFKEVGEKFMVQENFVSPLLRSQNVCELMCKEKYEPVCKILLWTHEVLLKLFEHQEVRPFDIFTNFLRSNNCTFSKAITIPKFHNGDESYDLLSTLDISLESCNDIIRYRKRQTIICLAALQAIYSLSNCSLMSENPDSLEIQADMNANVCEGFKNFVKRFPGSNRNVITYLENKLVCDSMCSEETETACKTILWAHEMKQSLQVKPIDDGLAEGKATDRSGMESQNFFPNLKVKDKSEILKLFDGSLITKKRIQHSNKKTDAEGSVLQESNAGEKIVQQKPIDSANNESQIEKQVLGKTIISNDTSENKDNMQLSKSEDVHHSLETSTIVDKIQLPLTISSSTEIPITERAAKKLFDEKFYPEKNTSGAENSKNAKDYETDHTSISETSLPNPKTASFIGEEDEDKGNEGVTLKDQLSSTVETSKNTDIVAVAITSNSSVMSESMTNIAPESEDLQSVASSSNTANPLTLSKETSDFDSPIVYDTPFGVNDQKAFEPTYKQFDKSAQEQFIEEESSHFFLYFLCIVALVTGCYIVIHNKQKVIALIVEGRHERRRRPHSASYKKLDTR